MSPGGRPRRTAAFLLAIALLGGTAACAATGFSSSASGGKGLTVFAAASLTETFTELGRTFESDHPGTKVTFNFGSSATLARQIAQGAPADVFAAANAVTMKAVTDAGHAANPTIFVRNKLQIAVPAANPAKVDGLEDLADPQVKVALCAPQVPCGDASAKALAAAGVSVKAVTLEQDVKATLTKVSLGEVDAALVYATDVKATAGRVTGIDFPEAGQAVNDYPIVALAQAPSAALARQFVELVLSERGKRVLARAGFQLP